MKTNRNLFRNSFFVVFVTETNFLAFWYQTIDNCLDILIDLNLGHASHFCTIVSFC